MADNSVGRVIDTVLRNDAIVIDELGFAPLDDTGPLLLFRFVATRLRTPLARRCQPPALRLLGRFLPKHTSAVSLLDPLLHHCQAVITDGERYRMREAAEREPPHEAVDRTRGGTFTWPPVGTATWP